MFEDLRLSIAQSKLEGPKDKAVFLGIEIDTIRMQIWLPAEKLSSVQSLIQSWIGRRSCYMRELESLVGSYFWCGAVGEDFSPADV